MSSPRRVLFVTHDCYLDDSNGAAVASRALMEALARRGFSVEALTGTVLGAGLDLDPSTWLAGRGLGFEVLGGDSWSLGAHGLWSDAPLHYRLDVRGVPVTLHHSPIGTPHDPDESERNEFLRLYECALGRFHPDVLVNYGGDLLAQEVRSRARERGAAVIFTLHNFNYTDTSPFTTADAVIVPSQFAADYYRKALGLYSTILPNLIDFERVKTEVRDPQYVTFVNPSYEKGVYAFARIADELGRQRPDIPLLVVEGRGTERTLADCGLDLRVHGNVNLMYHTHDPRKFLAVTRLCLMPSLWWENQPLVAVEAMLNGIPVIGSDRGGIPETLGDSGIVLPLPDRLTPATRILPTAEEMAPWVAAVIRLWDDQSSYAGHQQRALAASRRWVSDVLEPRYARFFNEMRPGVRPVGSDPPKLSNVAVLVPSVDAVGWECEQALRRLEEAGVRVTRREYSADLSQARDTLVSDALHDDAEAVLILDPDIDFDHRDAIRVLARPEPVIVGIGKGGVSFAPGVTGVHFGPGATGMYPLQQGRAEFLRIRTGALRQMVARLDLTLCDTDRGRGTWPFFQSMIVPRPGGGHRSLDGIEAFYHRLHRAGITPLADTSVGLTPVGRASPWSRAATAWDQVPGMFDYATVYDAAVADAPDGAVFVEIGCLAGRSTCYLGARIRESGKAITLYAVDTGRGSASDSTGQVIAPALGGSMAGILHRNLIGCGLDEIVVPIFTTSTRAARLFPPGSVDFCFIDADHRYASVLEDLQAWWPKVKPGATLAGHDYRQLAPWLVGVTMAVHEFFGIRDAAHPLCPSCWSAMKPREPS